MPSERYWFAADRPMLVGGDCLIEQQRANYLSINTSGSQKSTHALNDNATYIVAVSPKMATKPPFEIERPANASNLLSFLAL